MTTRRLLVTPSRCTGCRSCEIACAFSHPDRIGKPGKSTIRAYLYKLPDKGTPVVCLQCESAACVEVCPTDALVRNEATGAVDVDFDRCIRCRSCVYACPFGNISFDDAGNRVLKCDLCNGEPRCAQFCPTQSLQFI